MPDKFLQSDLSDLLTILGMSDHTRPQSPHEVFQLGLGRLREHLKAVAEMRSACSELVEAVIQNGADVPDAPLDRADRSLRDVFLLEIRE